MASLGTVPNYHQTEVLPQYVPKTRSTLKKKIQVFFLFQPRCGGKKVRTPVPVHIPDFRRKHLIVLERNTVQTCGQYRYSGFCTLLQKMVLHRGGWGKYQVALIGKCGN